MDVLALIPAYIMWHYTRALREYWHHTENVLWFIGHFFSLATLVRTFFAPWRRLDADKAEHEKLGDMFSRLIFNTIMRVVGAFLRFWILLVGISVLVLAAVMFAGGFIVWLILPFIIVAMLIRGIALLAGVSHLSPRSPIMLWNR